jgi:hypothetical protein
MWPAVNPGPKSRTLGAERRVRFTASGSPLWHDENRTHPLYQGYSVWVKPSAQEKNSPSIWEIRDNTQDRATGRGILVRGHMQEAAGGSVNTWQDY